MISTNSRTDVSKNSTQQSAMTQCSVSTTAAGRKVSILEREITAASGERTLTDLVDVLPLGRLALEFRRADTSPFGPVLELSVVAASRLPHDFARVRVDRPREPARLMRRELAGLALATSRALEVLQLGLEFIGALETAGFESMLIWPQTAVGRGEPRPQLIVEVVQGDRKRRPVRQ